jgi:hypothetical protein
MTTYRELLERAHDLLGQNVADSVEEIERLKADIAAYLAQPMTTCEELTAEEQKWADATMDNTKVWLVPSLRAAAGRVAESRAREGELVAVLEAQKAAHEYRFGPAGQEAETGEEMNAFMLKAQELDEIAWQLTRAALAQGKKE